MTAPILRTSERSTFARCPAKWWWSYREGLKPKGSERTPLWFGSCVHDALADWYRPGTRRGPHPAETFAKVAGDGLHMIKVADATEEAVAEYEDGLELGRVMLEGYVKKYGTDPQWEFISTEQTFQLDVPWPKDERQGLWVLDEESGLLVRYAGTFDGVYRDLATGLLYLVEHKTAKAIVLTHLPLDNQAGSYWAVASYVLAKQGLIKPGERISGINYNFLRKAMPDERPKDAEGYACNKPVKVDYAMALGLSPTGKLPTIAVLEEQARSRGITVLGERSKQQPLPLFHREMVNRTTAERKTQLSRIQDEALVMRAYRERLLPIVKNTDRSCASMCEFYQMCELQERGGDWETHKEVAFRVQDPYADHRKSTDE